MSILKKKTLWFTLYGILITVVFVYLLFPSDIVKSRLEDSLNSPDLIFKTESLRPSFPLGLKLKNITINSAPSGNFSFQSNLLDLQIGLLSFFKKHMYVGVSGRAYGGDFDGRFGLASLSRMYPPIEGKLSFQNIDLAKYILIKTLMGKELTGTAKGSLEYTLADEVNRNHSGKITLFLTKGTFPLAEPFLGLNRIDFDRGEMQAQLKNGVIKMEKLEVFGQQVNCYLKGEITPADDFKLSQLNLNGFMEILGKNKVKTTVNISGTLANPTFRYI